MVVALHSIPFQNIRAKDYCKFKVNCRTMLLLLEHKTMYEKLTVKEVALEEAFRELER
jgi:hypothetical protein